MPTYSCHFSDDESPGVDTAIAASPEKTEGRYIKEAIKQRMERDGFTPGSPKNDVRIEALATAEVIGERKTLEVLDAAKKEALAVRAANMS